MQYKSTALELIYKFLKDDPRRHFILDLARARTSILRIIADTDAIYTSCYDAGSLVSKTVSTPIYHNNATVEYGSIDYSKIFTHVLKNAATHQLSVILVWDFFNYMSRRQIIEMMAYLSPFCGPGARLFAISWLQNKIPDTPGNYELSHDKQLIYELTGFDTIQSPTYSAQEILDMMPCFVPNRLSVNSSGQLELLLEFSHLVTPPNPETIPPEKLTWQFPSL